jgi:hypothetical protein
MEARGPDGKLGVVGTLSILAHPAGGVYRTGMFVPGAKNVAG